MGNLHRRKRTTMPQIWIPGLNGHVIVSVSAVFDPDSERIGTNFPPSGADPEGRHAELKLTGRNRKTKLLITVWMQFPNYYDKENDYWVQAYSQEVTGNFDITQEDGFLTFSDRQIDLQGEPSQSWPFGFRENKFRFIDGTAWLASPELKTRTPVIKIKLTIGSQDVIVVYKGRTDTDSVKKSGTDISSKRGGKVLDGLINLEVTVTTKFETTDPVTSRTSAQTRTVGQVWQQRSWTLLLQVPQPKPKPEPPLRLTGHKVYFLTGKKDLGAARK
jgi:hypothetical protein